MAPPGPPLWLRYPAISPDGQTIAFSYQGDIYAVPSAGGNAMPLTLGESYEYAPVWSHDGKSLQHILDTFPRDELLQASDDDLYEIAIGILHLQERQRVALFVRRDPYERFVSCFVSFFVSIVNAP